MKLEELIEKIVLQSKDSRVASELDYIVGTLMGDIEDWPAWYFELFEDERRYDFSGKTPTPLQKLNLDTLSKLFVDQVKKDVLEFKSPDTKGRKVNYVNAARVIAERVTYWEDWYWDFAARMGGRAIGQEKEQYERIYQGEYASDDNGAGAFNGA